MRMALVIAAAFAAVMLAAPATAQQAPQATDPDIEATLASYDPANIADVCPQLSALDRFAISVAFDWSQDAAERAAEMEFECQQAQTPNSDIVLAQYRRDPRMQRMPRFRHQPMQSRQAAIYRHQQMIAQRRAFARQQAILRQRAAQMRRMQAMGRQLAHAPRPAIGRPLPPGHRSPRGYAPYGAGAPLAGYGAGNARGYGGYQEQASVSAIGPAPKATVGTGFIPAKNLGPGTYRCLPATGEPIAKDAPAIPRVTGNCRFPPRVAKAPAAVIAEEVYEEQTVIAAPPAPRCPGGEAPPCMK